MRQAPPIGSKVYWRKEEVEVITEADASRKVCIKDREGKMRLASVYDLEILPQDQIRCWWQKSIFVIRKTITNEGIVMVTIPKLLIPDVIGVMKGTKQSRQSFLIPRDEQPEARDTINYPFTEDGNED